MFYKLLSHEMTISILQNLIIDILNETVVFEYCIMIQ